jgi:hypothetical protein
VPVTIIGGTDLERAVIYGSLYAAADDINSSSGKLSASDTTTIQNIKSITVDDSQRTGVNQKSGVYNLKPSYILNGGTTIPWLASTIAHDAYHVTQYQHGDVYNRETAPRLKHEANQFQIHAGTAFGLTPSQLEYLKNDTHTLYNTSPLLGDSTEGQ